MTQVVLTGGMLVLAMVLFGMALAEMWPRVIAEAPKDPCGFMPPGA